MLSKLLFILAVPIILISCSGNTSAKNTDGSAINTSASATQSSTSDGHLDGTKGMFSYTLKGEPVVCRNYIQNSNLFINEASNDVANGILSIKVTTNSSSVFDFKIANSGTSSIKKSSPSLSGFADKKTKSASYMDGKTFKSFYGDSVTITVTSINDNRVTGTFTGMFTGNKNDGGTTVAITNGSFNLPFVEH